MIDFNFKNRLAFSMIELVFVVVVLGILASLAMPRLDRDLSQEAADTILANIRYTQHLAQLDNKHEYDDPQWQRKYWRIIFGTCTGNDRFFMIGADNDKTGSDNAYFDATEAALDPSNGKRMFWTNGTDCSNGGDAVTSPDIFISKKYGIRAVAPSGGCAGAAHIAFDHLGRPFHGVGFSNSTVPNYSGYMNATCSFTFTLSDGDSFRIDIAPETGYAHIATQDNS